MDSLTAVGPKLIWLHALCVLLLHCCCWLVSSCIHTHSHTTYWGTSQNAKPPMEVSDTKCAVLLRLLCRGSGTAALMTLTSLKFAHTLLPQTPCYMFTVCKVVDVVLLEAPETTMTHIDAGDNLMPFCCSTMYRH